jgi:hypothetical protein
MGSPNGAVPTTVTSTPGVSPISNSLREVLSSPEISKTCVVDPIFTVARDRIYGSCAGYSTESYPVIDGISRYSSPFVEMQSWESVS